ncbi:MAG TPA: 30S ribosomal protein S3 [Bacillota bacterium]
MGQKVHPKGLRIGIIRDWESRWFADRGEYARLLHEDVKIRDYIKKNFFDAGISTIEIERAANRVKITIHTAKPGIVIGKGGSGVERLRQDLEALTGRQISINVVEIKTPELDAQLLAEGIAAQLERRISFRRAMKQAAARAMRAGAQGVKVMVAGRLGGAEMSRTEWTALGSVPLHTLRADIDYGFAEAFTTYGQIGVKVWINRGEVLPERAQSQAAQEPAAGAEAARA